MCWRMAVPDHAFLGIEIQNQTDPSRLRISLRHGDLIRIWRTTHDNYLTWAKSVFDG